MKFSIYIYGLLLLALLCTDCVSEFEPPSQGYENLLVVEAFLTNDDKPFQVSLSRSTPIDTSAFIPESGASITLMRQDGEYYELYEYGYGRYSSQGAINAEIGQEYKISITTSQGRKYESDYVRMRETPPVDSVTFRYEERPTAGLRGLQIYVNTHDPENKTHYYRWEWEETWVFYTPYPSTHKYENGEILVRTENINQCWKENNSSSINIFSTKNLTSDIVRDYPLLYVSNETDRLGNRYSLNVKQYALSEESYNYWRELEKVTESLGTLFDPQPSTINGNIHNVNDDTEVVLGYFDASSVAEERIFINRSQIPKVPIPNYYQYCEDSTVNIFLVPEMVLRGYMLAYETQDEMGNFVYVMSYPGCIDCRRAGTNIKPDFWH